MKKNILSLSIELLDVPVHAGPVPEFESNSPSLVTQHLSQFVKSVDGGQATIDLDILRQHNIFFATPCYGGMITDQFFLSMFRVAQTEAYNQGVPSFANWSTFGVVAGDTIIVGNGEEFIIDEIQDAGQTAFIDMGIEVGEVETTNFSVEVTIEFNSSSVYSFIS